MKKWLALIIIVFSGIAFTSIIKKEGEYDPVPIPASQQRLGGDAQKGYDYLIKGDYIKGGIPYSFYVLGLGKDRTNFLNRGGKNENLPYSYTAITARNGEVLVAPNCLQCHAEIFNDSLVIGLGSSSIDFTFNKKMNVKNLQRLETVMKLTAPKNTRHQNLS